MAKKDNKKLLIAALLLGGGGYFLFNKKGNDYKGFPLLQNNNPLAILNTPSINWNGEASENNNPTWEAFKSMDYGWRAAILNGMAIADSMPNPTLDNFLYMWAKGGQGSRPLGYLTYVEQETGRPANLNMRNMFTPGNKDGLWEIYRAMAQFESSPDATALILATKPDYEKAWTMI